MKEILSITDIRKTEVYNSVVYLHQKNWKVCFLENQKIKPFIEEKTNNFTQYNDIFFYSLREEKNKIYALIKGEKKEILKVKADESVSLSHSILINSKLQVFIKKLGDFIPIGMFLINSDLEVERLDTAHRYDVKVKEIYFNYNRNEVFAYSNNFEKLYTVNICGFGRNIAKHPKTGEVLWDKPNEIKEVLLADDKNIYVPLKGGQLLALDAETGKKVWMWEQPRNGTFAIQGKYIYKQDGLTVFEIDTKTGELIRKKNFNDDVLVEKFHASGPLWVYKDVIIVCDVLYGKICLLSRNTLEVEEFFSLNKKLVNSKSAIRWNDNKLYVLDIDHTLHIFEK